MNQRVARQLRKIAHHRWSGLQPDYRNVISVKMVGKEVKKEYYEAQAKGRR